MPALSAEDLAGASREDLIVLVLALAERVEVLEAKVAALSATSANSSKPPSSDGYRKPPAPTSRRTRSGRKPGGQPGSPGATLRQVDEPDVVIAHRPTVCGHCHADLDPGEAGTGTKVASVAYRQVADLPEVVLRWTEHQLISLRCRCGKVTAPSAADGVPAHAAAPVQYGPGVRAVATWLVDAHFLPIQRCAEVMSQLLGAPVSPGSITTWRVRAGADLAAPGGFLETVRDGLREAAVLHADETGLRTAGTLAWVHVACSLALVLFSVHAGTGAGGRRGKNAIAATGIIDHLRHDAVLVSDAWGPYLSYAMLHALCGAHVIRELRAALDAAPACTTEAGSQSWAGKLLHFLEDLAAQVRAAKDAGQATLDPDVLAAKVATFEAILALGHEQNPDPPGGWPGAKRRPKHVNLLWRVEAHREDYLRFATDFDVPFTNNQAERDLRGVRLREKVSGSLRTLEGARTFTAIRSYLLTAQRQGRHALDVLRDLFNGRTWMPALPTT